jgi:hypothetical protein
VSRQRVSLLLKSRAAWPRNLTQGGVVGANTGGLIEEVRAEVDRARPSWPNQCQKVPISSSGDAARVAHDISMLARACSAITAARRKCGNGSFLRYGFVLHREQLTFSSCGRDHLHGRGQQDAWRSLA